MAGAGRLLWRSSSPAIAAQVISGCRKVLSVQIKGFYTTVTLLLHGPKACGQDLLTYHNCIALEDLFRASSAMSETVGQAAPLLFV